MDCLRVAAVAVLAWISLSQIQRDHVWRAVVGESVQPTISAADPIDHKPIEAIILPTRKLVSSTPDAALSTRFQGWKNAPSQPVVEKHARKLTRLEKEAAKAKAEVESEVVSAESVYARTQTRDEGASP